jgi:hypothetical protein
LVIINGGQSILTQALANTITQAQYGDDDTLEAISDTGLISPIASTLKNVSKLISGNSILVVHELLSLDAAGELLAEYELRTGSASITRNTTTPLAKTTTKEVVTTTVLYADYN